MDKIDSLITSLMKDGWKASKRAHPFQMYRHFKDGDTTISLTVYIWDVTASHDGGNFYFGFNCYRYYGKGRLRNKYPTSVFDTEEKSDWTIHTDQVNEDFITKVRKNITEMIDHIGHCITEKSIEAQAKNDDEAIVALRARITESIERVNQIRSRRGKEN